MATATDPLALDTPQYTHEELAAARAYINEARKHFALLLSYASDVTFHTTSVTSGDIAPGTGIPTLVDPSA